MDPADIAKLHLARGHCYGFFASFFLDADVRGLAESWPQVEGLAGELHALAHGTPPTSTRPASALDQHDAMAAEFARLFYGVGTTVIPAAGSCYDDELRLHCQRPYHAAREFYARHGRAKSEALGLPDDHVAVELAFMHELVTRGAAIDIQQEFLVGHLATWIPQFCGDIERLATLPSVRAVATSLRHLIAADAILLAMLSEMPVQG